MAAMHELNIFYGRKNLKIEVINKLNVKVILLIFKIANTNRLFKYL